MNYSYYRRYQKPVRKQSSFSSFFWFVLFLLLIVLGIRACVGVFGNIREEKRDEAILTIDRGFAEVVLWGHSDGTLASSTQIILEGDTIQTKEDSYVTLSFQNGTEIRLDENSRLIFSSFETDKDDDDLVLDLVKGRAYVYNMPKEKGVMELVLQTDVMNMVSYSGEFLAKNSTSEEYVYSVDGQINIKYMDRGGPEHLVVEELTMLEGSKSVFDSAKRQDFLDRSSVLLIEDAGEDLNEDVFYLWNVGDLALQGVPDSEDSEDTEEEQTEEEEEPVEEEIVEEEPEPEPEPEPEVETEVSNETLEIVINSPSSGSSINQNAIAIEGSIVSGSAASVTVTWSGNGIAYPLGLFAEGSSSFRYVADVLYENFVQGSNTYTIVAYDSDGNASNSVVIQITGDF